MKRVIDICVKFLKKNLLGMLIGGTIVGCISIVNADYSFKGTHVYYNNSSSGGASKNVQGSIDDLYSKIKYGNATAAQILKNQTALVEGKEVTGTMPNNGSMATNLSWGGSKNVPAGYTSGGTITCPAWSCASGHYCPSTSAGVAFTNATITPSTIDKTITLSTGNYITSGGTKTIAGDTDLVSGNIVRGVNIFGVVGSSNVFKKTSFSNVLGTITSYQDNTDITIAGHKFDDGTYIGKFTDGTWRRLSYSGSTYNYYSIITMPLPAGVTIGSNYIVQVSLGSDYATESEKKDDYGFRIGSDGARYSHSIQCSGTNETTNYGYISVDGGQWLDTSNSYAKDNAINTTCGVSNGKIYIKLESMSNDNATAKYCWWTRGTKFYLSGRIFYN